MFAAPSLPKMSQHCPLSSALRLGDTCRPTFQHNSRRRVNPNAIHESAHPLTRITRVHALPNLLDGPHALVLIGVDGPRHQSRHGLDPLQRDIFS